MNRLGALTLSMGLLVVAGGCQGMAPPGFFRPGPAEYQQSQAQRFDPYPENEPGPTVVGARPLEYQNPPAEVLRARWLPWNWGRQ